MKYLIPVLVGGAAITAAITTAIAQAHGALSGHALLTPPYIYGYGAAVVLLAIASVLAVNAHRQEEKKDAAASPPVIIHQENKQTIEANPQYCPRVAPHGYGPHPGKEGHGLIVTNPGYPAFNVNIPPATVGSLYKIVFPDRVPQLLERDHLCFFTAWLEHPTLPLRPGHDLFDVMRTNDIDQFTLDILYQDGDFRSYKSGCVIERDVWLPGGINVRFTGQEVVPTPTLPSASGI